MKYTKAALYGGLNYDMTDDELLIASQTYTKDISTEYLLSVASRSVMPTS